MSPISAANLKTFLLGIYDKVMHLKVYINSDDDDLKQVYINSIQTRHLKMQNNPDIIDAGFDLFTPGNEGEELQKYGDVIRFFGPNRQRNPVNKVDFKLCCSAQIVTDNGKTFATGYYLHPRSSISNTQLRLANATGIIDAGYRGNIMAMFDVVNIGYNNRNENGDFLGTKHDRYAQICAPGLIPLVVEIVNSKEELGNPTERGSGGFGSTGK
jgi:dUTPase